VDKGSSERFPRSFRIVRSSDYRIIYGEGRKVESHKLVLFVRNNQLGHPRLGITVSRKVGGAVVRNRIKRLFREIFRRSREYIPDSFDLVVNARQSCAGADYGLLREEFLAAVRKASRP